MNIFVCHELFYLEFYTFSKINLSHRSHCLFVIIPSQFLHNQIVRRHGIVDEFFSNVLLSSELYDNCIINYKGYLNIFCKRNNNRIKYRIFFFASWRVLIIRDTIYCYQYRSLLFTDCDYIKIIRDYPTPSANIVISFVSLKCLGSHKWFIQRNCLDMYILWKKHINFILMSNTFNK